METSLRLSRDTRALRIHAKQKFPVDSNTCLQVHGDLDTKQGTVSFVSAMIRQFYPEVSASFGLGVQHDKFNKLRYCVRAKKAFLVSSDGSITFNVKGQCHVDKEFKQNKSIGGAEFVWSVLDFQKEQDVRFKLGYEVSRKVAYVQLRENNWSVSADATGRWSLRYDL